MKKDSEGMGADRIEEAKTAGDELIETLTLRLGDPWSSVQDDDYFGELLKRARVVVRAQQEAEQQIARMAVELGKAENERNKALTKAARLDGSYKAAAQTADDLASRLRALEEERDRLRAQLGAAGRG